ncbi:hypothetical protein DRE_06458 [Drechslerella stenobrocha 248]|uniref:Uncharacterized protein n=1 Tax=Drechslerella stenobrocha 248 TaxID=1043628 RepID=W7I771_9PEZI|nr:hypothetical protein DRE_06458 [Drechslerella stenobrocha 248]
MAVGLRPGAAACCGVRHADVDQRRTEGNNLIPPVGHSPADNQSEAFPAGSCISKLHPFRPRPSQAPTAALSLSRGFDPSPIVERKNPSVQQPERSPGSQMRASGDLICRCSPSHDSNNPFLLVCSTGGYLRPGPIAVLIGCGLGSAHKALGTTDSPKPKFEANVSDAVTPEAAISDDFGRSLPHSSGHRVA